MDKRSQTWYYAEGRDNIRGVALVVHGLNLKPAKMETVIGVLTTAGMDVLLVSLQGRAAT